MATAAAPSSLATQARRAYTDSLLKGLPGVVNAVNEAARALASQPAEGGLQFKRRELVEGLNRSIAGWQSAMATAVRNAALAGGLSASRPGDLPRPSGRTDVLSLVDDDTIDREILTSRLALAMMDRASWEYNDVQARMTKLERQSELAPDDMMRTHVVARIVLDGWRAAGLTLEGWRLVQPTLHEQCAHLMEEVYHEVNRWLVERHVLPEIDLRPLIRRSHDSGSGMVGGTLPTRPGAPAAARMNVGEETRMQTRAAPLPARDHAEAVLGRLNRLIGRQLPGFAITSPGAAAAAPSRPMSPRLRAAVQEAQEGMLRRITAAAPAGPITARGAAPISTPALLEELQQRKQALKQAATTPVERATIEIVALLFQSILTEERIPAAVRVWFARLQMPVLRVAVGEPDFFATVDHPARRLIDRMGACVMGFDATARVVGDALEKEIKRVVQVVEAYPDTGRRVFQTVLNEFEKFLEHYFSNENEASRKGVSLAQQVEQRETLAIQYTIELRKMLNEVPVQEGVREFLFQVWADVLAMTAVKYGLHSEEIKAMKRAAADLIWSASAKVSREERAEVIRRLPPLLKTLRQGMMNVGVSAEKQDEHIHTLNNSLAAAFTAKAAAIPHERLEELMMRLETLEEMLPDADDAEIDESMVLDLSGHETAELEVVADGGSMPTPAMLAWARELQVGSWYMLDYRNRNEPVQLAWQGMRRQLSLFVSAQGRGVLFQQARLAAFLQAGLLLPAQDESLTVRATRSALAKLDVDPSRLLN
jgi:hypothetical protein